jgi:pyruvate/2-oxoglutarate dehydrogenase complex dihydrolipoamide dehydrogenase (E3) component
LGALFFRGHLIQKFIASFGLTEAQAKERGYEVKIGRFNFQANGKASDWAITPGGLR